MRPSRLAEAGVHACRLYSIDISIHTYTALVARAGLNEELSLKPAPYELANPLVELPAYLGMHTVNPHAHASHARLPS